MAFLRVPRLQAPCPWTTPACPEQSQHEMWPCPGGMQSRRPSPWGPARDTSDMQHARAAPVPLQRGPRRPQPCCHDSPPAYGALQPIARTGGGRARREGACHGRGSRPPRPVGQLLPPTHVSGASCRPRQPAGSQWPLPLQQPHEPRGSAPAHHPLLAAAPPRLAPAVAPPSAATTASAR